MEKKAVHRILAAYGIQGAQLMAVQKGYRNESHPFRLPDGGRLNFIVYKNEPDIQQTIANANRVADYAAARGLPARTTYDPRILRIASGQRTRFGSLYAYLPGDTIPWEAYTKEHIKLLGKAMSDLHAVLAALPGDSLPHVDDVYTNILDCMGRYFEDAQVQAAIRRKLGVLVPARSLQKCRAVLHMSRQLAGQQVLHMDFVRGNILFASQNERLQVSGILDFEKTAYGHPLFDIARTLAFLLVDCKYKEAGQVRKYFLYSGYTKRGASAFQSITFSNGLKKDISIIELLLNLFLLHDFYKFLRHNPYESLHLNEHFVRTRRLLIRRGVLHKLSA